MGGLLLKLGVPVLVLLSAVLYQTEMPKMISIFLGRGRTLENLDAFPYKCQRIYHQKLQACEDMWFSEATRQLFLACSDPLSRQRWMPNMGHFNASGRNMDDSIVAVDVDTISGDQLTLRILETPGFPGTHGDGRLHLLGFTGHDDEDGSIRLWVINMKPSVDISTGHVLDNAESGGNSTVELFRAEPGATSLEHVKTYAHPQIATPNRVAAVGGSSNSFFFTNDHGIDKTGWRNVLTPLIGGGDVSFCDDFGCKPVVTNQRFPNGLAIGRDGLLYVPSSALGTIDVYQPQLNGDLTLVDTLDTGYGLDNIAVDAKNNLYVAAIPDSLKFLKAAQDPLNLNPPATALVINKGLDGNYQYSKAIEDGLGEVLPGSTTVVHDVKTDRLFLSSPFSTFIAVCGPEPKPL